MVVVVVVVVNDQRGGGNGRTADIYIPPPPPPPRPPPPPPPRLPAAAIKAGDLVRGAAPASPAPAGAEKTGESPLAVEPSTASLAGGKATLTLTTLRRRGTTYLGSYQIKVVPYFFKNETGKIFITISDPLLQKAKGGGWWNLEGKR